MKEFVAKYKEVRVQTSRGKVNSTQFSKVKNKGQQDTIFISTKSLSRKRSQEAKKRRESLTRRQNSQGRGYFRIYNTTQSYDLNWRSQSQNGRKGGFYRKCSN